FKGGVTLTQPMLDLESLIIAANSRSMAPGLVISPRGVRISRSARAIPALMNRIPKPATSRMLREFFIHIRFPAGGVEHWGRKRELADRGFVGPDAALDCSPG